MEVERRYSRPRDINCGRRFGELGNPSRLQLGFTFYYYSLSSIGIFGSLDPIQTCSRLVNDVKANLVTSSHCKTRDTLIMTEPSSITMQQNPASSASSKPSRQPSSLACVTCRRRHLKCDAQMPVCSRCQASHTECRYIQSRRGLRTKNGDPPQQLLDDNASLFSGIDPDAFSDWLSGTALTSDLVDVWTFLRRMIWARSH